MLFKASKNFVDWFELSEKLLGGFTVVHSVARVGFMLGHLRFQVIFGQAVLGHQIQ